MTWSGCRPVYSPIPLRLREIRDTAATITSMTVTTSDPVAIGQKGLHDASPPITKHSGSAVRPTMRAVVIAGVCYLVLSVVLWWHIWTGSPSGEMTCACTDAGRMVWFLQWVATALAHGHNPLYSSYLFHPGGINLLSDTSVPALGVVLAPVTWLFGPVVSMNVANTLIPVADAMALFIVAHRYVRWTPAAFVGGLAFGFSVFVIPQLAYGWLNLTSIFLLPFLVATLEELLIRQRRPAWRSGLALGAMVVVQFFLSTEMLLLFAFSAAIATVLLVVWGLVGHRAEIRQRLPFIGRGLSVAVGLSVIVLAYPMWFFLAGPAHLGTVVWSTNIPGNLGNAVSNFWSAVGSWGPVGANLLALQARTLGGYLGPAGPAPSYLGPGLIAVPVIGVVVWRRDRRLWFFGALAVILAAFSLRVAPGLWSPWSVFLHVPLFQDALQSRFSAEIDLALAIMLAIVLEHVREAMRDRFGAGRRLCDLAPVAIAAVALAPLWWVLAPNVPLVVQSTSVPLWFRQVGPTLNATSVLLTYPFATADSQAAIPWQAISGMHYQMAGGGGPSGTVAHAGAERPGFVVLRNAALTLVPPPEPDAANLSAARKAMADWGVTTVVVPDGQELKAYQIGRGTAYGLAFTTALMGSLPTYQQHAWVWSTAPGHSPVPLSAAELANCDNRPEAEWGTIPACVLHLRSSG